MTAVNIETGELVDTLTEEDARRLTDRIRLLAAQVADSLDKMAALIDAARVGSAWLALGYRSWTEYVSTEFAGVLPRLDREPRQEFVRELTRRGMSTRAIAPVLGIDQKTVVNDRRAGEESSSPAPAPDPAEEGEADAGPGRTSAEVEARRTTEGDADDTSADIQPEVEPSPARPPVVGIDGKTYSAPPRPRQEQRPDAERMLNTLVMHADKAAREAQKLTAEQIRRVTPKADLWTVDLRNSLEVLQDLLTSLTKEK